MVTQSETHPRPAWRYHARVRCLALIALLTPLLAAGAPPAPPPPTVAVMYFDYQGKNEELALLRKGLAQMLISDLPSGGAYTVVERDRLQALLEELKLSKSAKVDPATAQKVGKLLGARYLVLGGYFDLLGTLRVDARVVRVETGEVVRSVGVHGKPDDFLDLEQRLARDLAEILDTQLTAADAPGPRRAPPKPPARLPAKTALRYAKALDKKDQGDKEGAKAELKAVLEAQPDFYVAQLDLNALMK
jgi:curli biogenesis system outer membrane secretion channel CsgG